MEIGPTTAAGRSESATSSIGSSSRENTSGSHNDIKSSNGRGGVGRFDLMDDEDEGDVCRICRNTGDADNTLRYPCACSGSIKFVHQDCLMQWLNHSNARRCEVCKHPFSFSAVYADNAPARLPFQEFIFGIAMKVYHVLQFFLRLSFVLSVWLLIIPFITIWIWRLAFVRSFGEAQRLFLSHISTTLILKDCLHGFLLSASIVFVFLGAIYLRDCIRRRRELGGQDADRVDEANRNGARNARRQAAQANRNIVVNGNGEELQAAQLEAQVEQMFDGLDDADGAEVVPFVELVGMQGPVFHLVKNAFTVLASNMTFLGVVIFVPFSIGRVILYNFSWILSSAINPVLSTVVPLTESALSLANITLKSALTAVVNLTSDYQDNSLLGHVAEILKVNATGENDMSNNITSTIATGILKVQSVGASRLSDVTTLAVGYIFIFSLVIFYIEVITLIRYSTGDRFYGIASIAVTILSLFRLFVAAMRRLMIVIKVAFLLVIELGVFPLMCGWWMDVCTIRMFGNSISQRVDFLSVSPLASSLVHWVVGIVYMLLLRTFVSLLRGVLRNGVLYFLRDPADPIYKPLRVLIDISMHRHARRILFSAAVSGSWIVMLVFLPVKLAMRLIPSIFPLDISVSDPFTEIPADMLLFQICIPFAIEHFKLRHTLKSLLRYWFTAIGWALGVTDFLLPKPEENDGNDYGNGDLGRHDRGHAHVVGQEHVLALEDVNRARHVVENANPVEAVDTGKPAGPERWAFKFRIVLLLVVAYMTLLVFNSALIIIPISLGRALFNALPLLPITHGIKCNDIYAFIIGSYVIWTVLAGARYCVDLIRTKRTRQLLNQIWKWCGIIVKSFALLLIWVFLIPVLIGLLFELLVIVPMRVPVDESPVFLLYQDWALGLIFLKIWTRMVMLDHMMLLVDESWRVKFARVREYGFSRLQGVWVLREIVYPIIMKLLTALCVPYVLSHGVFPIFGYSLVVNSAVYRYAWIGCLVFSVFFFCAKRFNVWFTNLHNSIRDDKYLIGCRLHDFGERRMNGDEGLRHVGRRA